MDSNLSKEPQLNTKSAHKIYEMMLLLRRFEEKAGQLYGMGLIGGFCHLYIGQEAVAIGIAEVLKKGDSVITSYRDHGMMLAMNTDPRTIMAELFGKETGCSKGKGGSMHMFDVENGFFGGHGIVGAQVPIGTGLGFAHQYKNQDNISVTLLGDGAINQGQVYEAFNMAKLWNIPVIYVIENNEYAMGTSTKRSTSILDLSKRGESFGIPGMQVDGMNVLSVYQAMQDAVLHIKQNKGPILLEMKTYRYRGHSMSDPARYRSKDELEKYKENSDPIVLFKKYIAKHELISEKTLEEIEGKVKNIVKEAVEFAQNSKEPSIDELYTEIYNT